MKLTIKNGFAIPINPFTEKEFRKAFAKKYPKYKVYLADGETPFPDTKEVDLIEFSKVFKVGLQKSVLVQKELNISECMVKWISMEEQPLKPEQMEVIGFHESWIDPDYNPNGTRAGFIDDEGEFTCARWCNIHDIYENEISMAPSHYMIIPKHP